MLGEGTMHFIDHHASNTQYSIALQHTERWRWNARKLNLNVDVFGSFLENKLIYLLYILVAVFPPSTLSLSGPHLLLCSHHPAHFPLLSVRKGRSPMHVNKTQLSKSQ